MKTWVRKILSVGVLAAGALLFGPGVAHADVHQDSYYNNGILNGTQIYAPVDVPINICGDTLSLLSGTHAHAFCANGHGHRVSRAGQHSHHNNGILNGGQVYAPIRLPVNFCGDAFDLLGGVQAAAFCSNSHGGVKGDHGHRHGHGGVKGDHGHRHGHGGVKGDHGSGHGRGQDCDAVHTGGHNKSLGGGAKNLGGAQNVGGGAKNLGGGAALGDDDTKYGSNSRSMGGRSTAQPAEASSVSDLTQAIGAADLGRLDLLKAAG